MFVYNNNYYYLQILKTKIRERKLDWKAGKNIKLSVYVDSILVYIWYHNLPRGQTIH